MKRTESQRVMDEARGDPDGSARLTQYERYKFHRDRAHDHDRLQDEIDDFVAALWGESFRFRDGPWRILAHLHILAAREIREQSMFFRPVPLRVEIPIGKFTWQPIEPSFVSTPADPSFCRVE